MEMKAVFHGLNYFYLSLAAYVKASMIRFWKKGGTAPDYYLASRCPEKQVQLPISLRGKRESPRFFLQYSWGSGR
jgi:hypothetical protein